MQTILDWSEVWATLLPILVYLIKRPAQATLTPVIFYLLIAIVLNVLIDLAYFKIFTNNGFLYNILSICRLFIFIWFFTLLNIPSIKRNRKSIFFIVAIFISIIFLFFDPFIEYSSKVFTLEAIVLLIFCITYFLSMLRSNKASAEFDAVLIIITGLAVYEAVCFFIFLFYDLLSKEEENFAVKIWDVHNIAYIVFCLFIVQAFYGRRIFQYS